MSLQTSSVSLDDILREILPRVEDLRVEPSPASHNSIYHLNIVIYGKARRGKTELANSIVSSLLQAYGPTQVHVCYKITDLETALDQGWEPGRLVQVLVVDDLTLAEHTVETYKRYFEIGHVMEEKTGQQNGLVVTVLIVHRFFSLPKELRADIDLLAVKSVSSNPSDANLLRSFLGQELVNELSSVDKNRRDVFAYYVRPDYRGITTFQPSEASYLPRTSSYGRETGREETEDPRLQPSEVRIIQDIASGRDTVNLLLKEIGWSKPALQDEVERMVADGYVTVEGFRKHLHITPKAYDQVPRLPNRIPKEKKPKTHATKVDVSWWLSFKLIFGALLGLFFGWLLISGLAALIYWAAYTFFLQPYMPANILPWVPFKNPIVDFALGIISGTWFFLKINPTQFFTSFSKK
jgi:hypothetical protein